MTRSRRRHVVPAMLRGHHIKDSLRLSRPTVLSNSALAGLQAALAVAVALPLVQISPWSHLIGFAGLGALSALFGRFAPHGRRTVTVAMAALCQTGSVVVMSLAALSGMPMAALVVVLALMGGLLFIISNKGRFGPPGALIFLFAATASMSDPGSLVRVAERGLMTGAVALLAVLLCALTEPLRFKGDEERLLPIEPEHDRRSLLTIAGRISIGCLVASYLAMALGMEHASWAALGATAVLMGKRLHPSLHRAFQRSAGTVIGGLMIWVLLGFNPNVWVVIGCIVLLQILTEIFIGYNYAIGQMFVTPMALLMTYLATPSVPGFDLASERIIDTLLGAAVGLMIAIIMSNNGDRSEFIAKHRKV